MHTLVVRLALVGALAAAALAAGLTLARPAVGPVDAGPGDPTDTGAHHAHGAPMAADAVIDGASIHHLADLWIDQHGRPLRLGDVRGHPTVVVMFYGNCMTACPVLLRDAERIDAGLDDADRAATRFLMVTFDPERDTPERLAAYAAEKGLDRERWSFLSSDPRSIQRLAAALGVRYRADGQGGFAHTNLVTILDPAGRIGFRLEGLGSDVAPAVAAIRAMR